MQPRYMYNDSPSLYPKASRLILLSRRREMLDLLGFLLEVLTHYSFAFGTGVGSLKVKVGESIETARTWQTH